MFYSQMDYCSKGLSVKEESTKMTYLLASCAFLQDSATTEKYVKLPEELQGVLQRLLKVIGREH